MTARAAPHQRTESLSWAFARVTGGLHVLGAACLVLAAREHPVLFGVGALAYVLGLRHAFDVDHIAAIDNMARKLVQQREGVTGVGFFFSLGHSTVVFLLALGVGAAARWAQYGLPHLRDIGELIGTAVSGSFLIFIGMLNCFIWLDIHRTFREMKRGACDAQALERLLVSHGVLARFACPLFRMIDRDWHAYPT